MAADLDRLTEDLATLVRVPSVTGDESAVQDVAASLLAEAGLLVERISPDPESLRSDPAYPGTEVPRSSLPIVVGRADGKRPGPRILLLGHLDVVPPGDALTWSSPPFEPRVADGRLYGRGACDMKGGVVAMIEAVRLLLANGRDFAGEVIVATVPSEEDGGLGTLATIRAGVAADFAVIPEPTNLEVVIAHAGAITFELTVPGKAAHASTRLEGISALDKLSYLMAALLADEAARNAAESDPIMSELVMPYPTIIGTVAGGSWPSSVMDSVVANGRYGVRLGQTPAEAEAELVAAVTEAWSRDEFLASHPVAVRVWGGSFGSCRVPSDHPLPVGLAAAAEHVTGKRPALIGAPYGADMRLLVTEAAIPTVMYGPGSVLHAHSADEFVSLEEVTACAEVLAHWMASLLT